MQHQWRCQSSQDVILGLLGGMMREGSADPGQALQHIGLYINIPCCIFALLWDSQMSNVACFCCLDVLFPEGSTLTPGAASRWRYLHSSEIHT